MSDNVVMPDPVAFFLTWPTYGTWLPGDERGWIEYRHGWQLPNCNLEISCKMMMQEKQCLLSKVERQLVIDQIAETCRYRQWICYAVDCRSNHLHIVVGAPHTSAQKVCSDIKAWCTRRLKEYSDSTRTRWWAERGSVRYVWTEESLETVVQYVTEAQNRKGREQL